MKIWLPNCIANFTTDSWSQWSNWRSYRS